MMPRAKVRRPESMMRKHEPIVAPARAIGFDTRRKGRCGFLVSSDDGETNGRENVYMVVLTGKWPAFSGIRRGTAKRVGGGACGARRSAVSRTLAVP
jgi:hypothetical protein